MSRRTECAWAFNPLGPIVGQSIDEMKMHYELQRDQEFASHVCAEHREPQKTPVSKITGEHSAE
jgi:hypothetical protein